MNDMVSTYFLCASPLPSPPPSPPLQQQEKNMGHDNARAQGQPAAHCQGQARGRPSKSALSKKHRPVLRMVV